MQLHSYRVKNFRRLKDVYIDLEKDVSIFVGANNSGKTSATHALQMFINGSKNSFTLYDFTLDCWDTFDDIGKKYVKDCEFYKELPEQELNKKFPRITLDLWFKVEPNEAYLAVPLIPNLQWKGNKVGIRVAFMPSDDRKLLEKYKELKRKAIRIEKSETKNKVDQLANDLMDGLETILLKEKLRQLVNDPIEESFNTLEAQQLLQLVKDRIEESFNTLEKETVDKLAKDLIEGLETILLKEKLGQLVNDPIEELVNTLEKETVGQLKKELLDQLNNTLEPEKVDQRMQQLAEETVKKQDSSLASKIWPSSLMDFLKQELSNYYELRYFILDPDKVDTNSGDFLPDYTPYMFKEAESGLKSLKSLIRMDCVNAQRHLADTSKINNDVHAADVSKLFSDFYKNNLEQMEHKSSALQVLSSAEKSFNEHLDKVFYEVTNDLANLSYPGVDNPILKIRSALEPAMALTQDTRVLYKIGATEDDYFLPDSYNGLGFKNLFYMVIQILALKKSWESMQDRPPVHIIIIEEPEAHMHVQLQQVFIRQIGDLIIKRDDDNKDETNSPDEKKSEKSENKIFNNQLIVTTHSPHILYERGFTPIRYFRRKTGGIKQTTEVLNLSNFVNKAPSLIGQEQEGIDINFLERYLAQTHCDLFFADAVILIEGAAERLLLPAMINKLEKGQVIKTLSSSCICKLEISGRHFHKFLPLIGFLGVPTLIITDIDSTKGKKNKTCFVKDKNACTSNDVLKRLFSKNSEEAGPKNKPPVYITQLEKLSDEDKFLRLDNSMNIRVAYQEEREVTWNNNTEKVYGRTFEDDFCLENINWCDTAGGTTPLTLKEQINLLVKATNNPIDLAQKLHDALNPRTKGGKKGDSKIDKVNFALTIMSDEPDKWNVPTYIENGLKWLAKELSHKTHDKK